MYIILARVLGPEQYDLFAAAAALGGILSLIIQFGLPTLLGREVAANPEEGPKSTLACLLLEALIAIPVFLLLFPLARALGYTGSGLVVCYLVILAEVGRSAKLTLRGVLWGLNQFGTEAASVTLERLLIDIVMLKAIAPPGEAGYYSAAYRVMEIFSALPRVIFYVAFTKFARCHAREPERLPQEIYQSTRLLLVVVLPVLLIAGFLQTSLIQMIYGNVYLPSVSSLAVLSSWWARFC